MPKAPTSFYETCLHMSSIAFWFFVILVIIDYVTRLLKKPDVKPEMKNLAASDIPSTIEALAKLADSFSKAGPALAALVASLAFMAFAAIPTAVEAIKKAG